MTPTPTTALLAKLRARDQITADEQLAIESLVHEPGVVAAGQDIVAEGERPSKSTLLLSGFAGRYKVLEGGGRQITAVHTAGDFVDLHSFLLKEMDHGVLALTTCRVAKASHTDLARLSETHPHLMRLLWLMTLIDGAIHREWLVAMGRMPAIAHAAHLICEIYLQLATVAMAPDYRFEFGITQSDLADMLGLSSVHVNRVLQELRGQELIRWDGQHLTILDWPGLQQAGQFTPGYLNLRSEPR